MELKDAPKSTTTNSLMVATKGVQFVCPNCGKGKIIRTNREKALGVKWVCPVCGYVGP